MTSVTKIVVPDTKIIGRTIELDFNEFDAYFVGTNNIKESNYFLNSLWRNFNEELYPKNLERCPWYYVPNKFRINQLVVTYLGSLRTRVGYFHVAVSYKTKGNINNIHLLPFESTINMKEINSIIKGLIKKAKKEIKLRFSYSVSCKLIGKFPSQNETISLLDYVSDKYIIKESVFTTIISAQDLTDAKRIASNKLRSIVNFLSVETNLYFIYESLNVQETDNEYILDNYELNSTYQEDLEYNVVGFVNERFIDFYPALKGFALLSKQGKKFINRIVKTDLENDLNLNTFLNSCYHFREGIKSEILIYNRHILTTDNLCIMATKNDQVERQTIIDVAVTHYLSSVEIVTLIGHKPEKCGSCGQLKFQINRRVFEFINLHVGEIYGDIFKKIYNLRSLYLHSGISYSKNQDTNTRPLLDENTGTGSVDYNSITLNVKGGVVGFGIENIREWTGYGLRNFYRDSSL